LGKKYKWGKWSLLPILNNEARTPNWPHKNKKKFEKVAPPNFVNVFPQKNCTGSGSASRHFAQYVFKF